jgi:thiamine kinase-like enzyme
MYSGMNDLAYDISPLFESEMIELDGRHFRSAKAPAPVPCRASNLEALQEAMARELLQEGDAHEAFIQQYLRMAGDLPLGLYAS